MSMKTIVRGLVAACSVALGLNAWADDVNLTRKNPVTGQDVTFTYYYAGSSATADQATDWNKADGTHPETVPDALGKGPYAPFIVDGALTSVAPGGEGYKTIALAPQEGWDFQVGAFNHVNLDLGTPGKIQGTSWFMIDATSKMVVDYSKGNVDGAFNLYVAGELTFTKYTQNKAASYYLKDSGVVTFTTAPTAGTHTIKQGDFKLSAVQAYKKIAKKYLVTFGDGTRDFVLTGATITATDAEGGSVTTTLKAVLTTNDAVGCYTLGQDANGVYIAYVDYTDEEPVPETPTLIANGGTVDVSVESNWQGGKMPETGDDIIVIVKADSAIYVPSALTVGKMSVTGAGAFTIDATDTQKITATETVVDADISFRPATLAPGLLTINEGKTATLTMYSNSTLQGVRGKGALAVNASGYTLTMKKNGTIGATVSESTVKLNGGTIHFDSTGAGDGQLTNARFELANGTSITQWGWVYASGTVEVNVAEGTASAFTQSKLANASNGVFKKTGAGTLEVNAAIATASATIEEGTLIIGTTNGHSCDAAITSAAGASVIKKSGTTTTFAGAVTLNGGLEIQENGGVILNSSNVSIILGITGAGAVTMSGSGEVKIGAKTVGAEKRSLDGGVVVNINASKLHFGHEDIGEGSWLGDCTISFNGGSARAHGWPEVYGTVNVITTQDGVMEGSNAGNSTRGNGDDAKLVKKGTGMLQWKSIFRKLPVVIEEGSIDKSVSAHGFADGSTVKLAAEDVTFKVSSKLDDGVVLSGVTGYDVAFDTDTTTYSLVEAPAFPPYVDEGHQSLYTAWTTTGAAAGYDLTKIETDLAAQAFALNCAPTEDAVTAVKAGFIVVIEFNEGIPYVSIPAREKGFEFNIDPVVQGKVELTDDEWHDLEGGLVNDEHFFRAVIVIPGQDK